MKVQIRTLQKETIDIEIADSGTVEDIKIILGTIKDVTAETIKLVFKGAVLDRNEKLASECGITNGASIVALFQKSKPVQTPVVPPPTVQPTMQQTTSFFEPILQTVLNQSPMQAPQMQSSASSPLFGLTTQEKNDISQLVAMGFSPQNCVQYYMACDKNVELATNMLLDQSLDGNENNTYDTDEDSIMEDVD